MDKGLHLGLKSHYLDRVVQKSADLSLLGKGDGAEVMLQRIDSNQTVFIEPSDISDTMEFFYLLEGELEIDNSGNKSYLVTGDYFYTHHLIETIQFKTLTDVTLLYFSTRPLFHYLSTTIRDLTELAEKVGKKDRYTHSHNQRVKDYAVKIGNKLNLSKEKIEDIVFASLFHDLGKINVPDEILNKPGRLTAEEFEYIKKHPSDGADLVKATYYENIAEIIEQHHERLNGSGYPKGLKGDQILIEAKIIAVSDAYDAMTTDRPYRKGMSPKDAVDELIKLKGIHYDEMVVDAFIDVLIEEGIL